MTANTKRRRNGRQGARTLYVWLTFAVPFVMGAVGAGTATTFLERSEPRSSRAAVFVSHLAASHEDAQPAIQAAIDAADNGADVILSPGIYKISKSLVLKRGIGLLGRGSIHVQRGGLIDYRGSVTFAWTGSTGGAILAANGELRMARVENIVFSEYIRGMENSPVAPSTSIAQAHGIRLFAPAAGAGIEGACIFNCAFIGLGVGIEIAGELDRSCENVVVERCRFWNCATGVVQNTENSYLTKYDNCHFTDGSRGIWAKAGHFEISGRCFFAGFAEAAIQVDRGSGTIISAYSENHRAPFLLFKGAAPSAPAGSITLVGCDVRHVDQTPLIPAISNISDGSIFLLGCTLTQSVSQESRIGKTVLVACSTIKPPVGILANVIRFGELRGDISGDAGTSAGILTIDSGKAGSPQLQLRNNRSGEAIALSSSREGTVAIDQVGRRTGPVWDFNDLSYNLGEFSLGGLPVIHPPLGSDAGWKMYVMRDESGKLTLYVKLGQTEPHAIARQ